MILESIKMNLKSYKIKNKEMNFPIFLPDATRAVIRSLDSKDILNSSIEGVVVNAYHLFQEPGIDILKSVGGVKRFMGFDGWVTSDSGGFQLYSLIHNNPDLGRIDDEGIKIKKGLGGKTGKFLFTPEKSIETQFEIGADILICLDDCPKRDANEKELGLSLKRTIEWGKRSKDEFERQVKKRNLKEKPILLAVIQGGSNKELRKECAQELIKIGFDGYGFGGWPMDEEGKLNRDILEYTANLMPDNLPKFALGLGSVEGIVEGVKMGYNIFDCVLPTRDARHKRLYVFNRDLDSIDFSDNNFFDFLYINREVYSQDKNPVSQYCDCHTCENYSRSYLRHLFSIGDSLAWRLATIHNLRFYSQLIELLRNKLV